MHEREGEFRRFPSGFLWGTATASYQIEGTAMEQGRGESIWDRFARTPGKVVNGDTGDVACDHFHRYRDDVRLMSELGVDAYRLSVAWPRILPNGRGTPNSAGLDFYDRLVDSLLEKGIRPFVTLYHWDLPQVLEDEGGWPRRETAYAFRDYADVVARRLGDRVKDWITHNEPWCTSMLGYYLGQHAPGRTELGPAIQASHNVMLSHGLAVEPIRAASRCARVGITLNFSASLPASATDRDEEAALRADGFANRWFLDPIFRGHYPKDMLELYGALAPKVEPGDLATISVPTDFLGVNYYTCNVQKDDPAAGIVRAREVPPRGPEHEYTAMDWEVYPKGLYDLLMRLTNEYKVNQMYVTENGAAYADELTPEREVDDQDRLEYLRKHFVACQKAIVDGAPLAGYFVWSLMDNFEWAWGYTRRFGIVYCDFATQERILKSSAKWFREVVAENGLVG
jgi:beta-glucosidase